jgi:hypothetical protein
VSWKVERAPNNGKNCFGRTSREAGNVHNPNRGKAEKFDQHTPAIPSFGDLEKNGPHFRTVTNFPLLRPAFQGRGGAQSLEVRISRNSLVWRSHCQMFNVGDPTKTSNSVAMALTVSD